ncbi:MAG: hypothetical protein HC913_04595 [Microscillaceae bacterium]|nr:hypothetical protein [Microscillaceae bacterium]
MNKLLFIYLILGLLGLGACNKEFDFIKPLPNLTFVRGVEAKFGPRGTLVRIRMDLQAGNQLGSLKVSESIEGADFSEVETITSFEEDFRVPEFAYSYLVDTLQYPSLADGDKIQLKFELADRVGNVSNPLIFDITVGGTFIVREENINGTTVTAIRRPQGAALTLINDEEFVFESGQKYLIQGIIEIEEGLTVRIQPGAEIYAETGGGELAVFRVPAGARLEAEGTANAPIVFTSDKVLKGEMPQPGDWQGLEVFGNSVINAVTSESPAPEDDSGIFQYIRVEYGGSSATEPGNREANIRFVNVGAGTHIQYVQSFKSDEIGIRFNGGNARAKYLVVTDPSEHAYRLDDVEGSPFRGLGQFWITENSGINYAEEDLRIDDGAGATLSNLTFLGPGQGSGFGNDMARVRDDAQFYKIFNSIVAEYPGYAFRAQNSPAPTNLNGDNVVGHSYFFAISGDIFRDNAGSLNQAQFNNTIGVAIAGIAINQYVPDATVASTFDPSQLEAWFSPALFVGAIANASQDWTANGTWCKNPDGSIR